MKFLYIFHYETVIIVYLWSDPKKWSPDCQDSFNWELAKDEDRLAVPEGYLFMWDASSSKLIYLEYR